MTPEEVEKLARECYHRLCPHAPKDLPIDKSTTMKAFLEGYFTNRFVSPPIEPAELTEEELAWLKEDEERHGK
jgi:hypothetical protein